MVANMVGLGQAWRRFSDAPVRTPHLLCLMGRIGVSRVMDLACSVRQIVSRKMCIPSIPSVFYAPVDDPVFMLQRFRFTKHPPFGVRLTQVQFNRLGRTKESKRLDRCRYLLLVTMLNEEGGQCH